MEGRKVYSGTITELKSNQIFVFGSNPEGRHGKGAAKMALKFGAKYSQGRGLQGQAYALVTKNLRAGYYEKASGLTYARSGEKSVSKRRLIKNIQELYDLAKQMPKHKFLVAYSGRGTNLNGYTSAEMAEMFRAAGRIPRNIVFEEKFAELLNTEL